MHSDTWGVDRIVQWLSACNDIGKVDISSALALWACLVTTSNTDLPCLGIDPHLPREIYARFIELDKKLPDLKPFDLKMGMQSFQAWKQTYFLGCLIKLLSCPRIVVEF